MISRENFRYNKDSIFYQNLKSRKAIIWLQYKISLINWAFPKALYQKRLITLQTLAKLYEKSILDTAVEMGYSRLRRQKNEAKKIFGIIIENMEYEEPHQFGYDFIIGFRQMAEPAGFVVDVIEMTEQIQKKMPYDVFMLQNDYIGAFVLGFSLNDPWMKDFKTSHTPTVLYDNYIPANPFIASIGIDNKEGWHLLLIPPKKLGHHKIGYLSSALGSYIMQVRTRHFLMP